MHDSYIRFVKGKCARELCTIFVHLCRSKVIPEFLNLFLTKHVPSN